MTSPVTTHYMTTEGVLSYVKARLRVPGSRRTENRTGEHTKALHSTTSGRDAQNVSSRKKHLAQRLVDFWNGDDSPPDSLNQHILLTARLLQFEVSEEAAVEVLERYCTDHPDHSFSDRLSASRYSEVSRVIRGTVRAVYDNNGGQPDPAGSTRILEKAHTFLRRIGFRVSDKSTWGAISTLRSGLGPDFEWSPEEVEAIRQQIVPVLKTDLYTALGATKHFIRFVKAHEGREICRNSLPAILRDFDLNIKKSKKKSDFLKALINLQWIAINKDHEWFDRKSGRKGKARQYVVGQGLLHKFPVIEPQRTTENNGAGVFFVQEDSSPSL